MEKILFYHFTIKLFKKHKLIFSLSLKMPKHWKLNCRLAKTVLEN